jgi:hypothetical protein
MSRHKASRWRLSVRSLERGHTAVWTDPKSALDLWDNDGDRAILRNLFT